MLLMESFKVEIKRSYDGLKSSLIDRAPNSNVDRPSARRSEMDMCVAIVYSIQDAY